MRNLVSLVLLIAISIALSLDSLGAHSLYVSVGIDSATVYLDDINYGYTDDNGVFFGQPVQTGFHILRIEKEGFRSVSDTAFFQPKLTYNYLKPLESESVRLMSEISGKEQAEVAGPYTIQAGFFKNEANARRLYAALQAAGYEPRLETYDDRRHGTGFRVRVSVYDNLDNARRAATNIVATLKLVPNAWIVGLEGLDWAIQLLTTPSHVKALGVAAQAASISGAYTWVEEVEGSGTYRVKAGYWKERTEAESAAARLAQALNITPDVLQVR